MVAIPREKREQRPAGLTLGIIYPNLFRLLGVERRNSNSNILNVVHGWHCQFSAMNVVLASSRKFSLLRR